MRSATKERRSFYVMADIDKDHDLSDPEVFRHKMKQEDQESKAPCGSCRLECVDPTRCKPYKDWRKKYLQKRYR